MKPARPQQWIVVYALLLHMAWGLLYLSPHAAGVRPTAAGSLVDLFGAGPGLGVVLISVSLATVVAVARRPPPLWTLLLLLPQQVVMLSSMGDALEAVARGQYADGVERPRAFILVDQLPAILAGVLHIGAVRDEVAAAWGRRQ